MADGIHIVVVYVHEGTKRFSATARMQRARLPGVDEQMAAEGYSRVVVAERLEKEEAELLREQVCDEWIQKGYSYQTRPALS